MVSTYTDNLGFNKQGDNDNPDSWGDILNEEVIALIEEAITGRAAASKIDVTGEIADRFIEILNGAASDTSGVGTNKARCAILETEGALGNDINLNLPTIYKTYVFLGGHTNGIVNLTHSGTTDIVSLNEDDVAFIYTTPTSIRLIAGTAGTGGGTSLVAENNLSDLTDTAQAILNLGVYPVGTVHMSLDGTDPGTRFGGTWEQVAQGRVIIGAGTSTPDDNGDTRVFTPDETGGEFEHDLKISEIPSHTHNGKSYTFKTGDDFGPGLGIRFFNELDSPTSATGGGQPHNNVQPYLAVNIWKRIA